MEKLIKIGISVILFWVLGCARIDFGGEGLTYYEPKPYLFVSTTKECVTTATVVIIPETKKVMKFETGYGSSDLSVTLTNGMVASVGQKTDSKIPETITSIASLGTAAALYKTSIEEQKKEGCKPSAILYPIENGIPNENAPINFSDQIK